MKPLRANAVEEAMVVQLDRHLGPAEMPEPTTGVRTRLDDAQLDMDPILFFETEPLRQRLSRGPARAQQFASERGAAPKAYKGAPPGPIQARIEVHAAWCRAWGLVAYVDAGGELLRLTSEGRASLRWAAPPIGIADTPARWVADVARGIADLYRVGHGDMLKSRQPGPHVIARARLCAALMARGWDASHVERFFGMPEGLAAAGLARWRRMRG